MPRYRTAGGLDDVTVEDGDVGFVGVNSRLPRWQLSPGFLALSENCRIDGGIVARKGVDVLADGSVIENTALRLPFWLIDQVGGEVVTAAERTGEDVTLTVPGHGITSGAFAEVIVDPSGADNSVEYTAVAVGPDGGDISIEYQIQTSYNDIAVGVSDTAITVISGDSAMMVIGGTGAISGNPIAPLYLWRDGFADIYPLWRAGDYSIQSDEGGFWYIQNNDLGEAWVSIVAGASPEGLTYQASGGNASGVPTVTASAASAAQVSAKVNADAYASLLVDAVPVGTGYGPVSAVGPVFLQGGSSSDAYLGLENIGGVPVVDPEGVWLMTPTDANTLTFSIPGAVGNETYTVSGATVVLSRLDDTAAADVLGSCLYSDPSSNNDESIFLAFGTTVRRVSLSDGSVTSYGLPGSDTIDVPCTMLQAMDKVLIFRDGEVAYQWERGDTDFSAVPSGAYTQPQVFEVTGTFVDVVSGLCTITGLTNNTVAAGDTIRIYDSNDPHFEPFKDKSYFITAANATSFSFYIPVEDLTTIGTNTLSIGRQVSVSGGFIHQPAFPWAICFQRRLWGPYKWTYTGPGFTSRDINDEIVASDILDLDTYDPIYNQFRITAGTADYIVALQPFFEDTLIVLNRNSIHGIFGTIGSLQDTSVRELTREIGCTARKSVANQGSYIFFLSDSGVYQLEFLNDYNPRGVEEPLSKDIQPYIDRINQSLASESIGVYFDNRYWLAVPLDSIAGANDAQGNNVILVFNLKNRAWESLDTFGDESFLINNLLIGSAGTRNDLYAVTSAGGIHRLNALDQDYDNISTNPVTGALPFAVQSVFQTRGYLNSTGERKRFQDFGMQMKSNAAQSDLGVTFTTEDPDITGAELMISTTTYPPGPLPAYENADIRARIGGQRGFYGSFTIRRDFGRPTVEGIKVAATTGAKQTLTQQ